MHSYTITIGRNVGDTPMNEQEWALFCIEARDALVRFAAPADLCEWHTGHGVWELTPEESFKSTLLTETPLGEALLRDLKFDLAWLARRFNQDAIALTIGRSILIGKEG